MAKRWLTDATRGPWRRLITVVSLVAAAVALIMTVAMVVIALAGSSTSVLRLCFTAWVVSLIVVFAGTRLLRTDEPSPNDVSD